MIPRILIVSNSYREARHNFNKYIKSKHYLANIPDMSVVNLEIGAIVEFASVSSIEEAYKHSGMEYIKIEGLNDISNIDVVNFLKTRVRV